MGEAIVELINVLNSKEEKINQQEGQVFLECKNRAIKGFAIGGSIATGVVWVASRKLNNFLRVNLAGGAGFLAGMWGLKESIDSSVNRILEMEGTRMQHELRKIVVEKYGNNPQRMKPFSKHFYVEEVMNDSAPGNPKSVYRQRNIYVEEQQIANRDTYGVPDVNESDMYHQLRNGSKLRTGAGARQVHINPAVAMAAYGDPLEVLFGGYAPANDEPLQPDDSITSAKAQTRSQRRAHRRHRMRNRQTESSLLEEA
uniref:Uncharacterized protein n=1 Tax=Opuntia streptacantha TaxID=393608 RepID=A0A7C9E2D8_OPUST